MLSAVRAANRYISAGIKHSQTIGHGSGPINHFHSTYTLPFSPDHFIDYILERPDVQSHWRAYTEHEFVRQMADGTLPVEKFKYYRSLGSIEGALALFGGWTGIDLNKYGDDEELRHVESNTIRWVELFFFSLLSKTPEV